MKELTWPIRTNLKETFERLRRRRERSHVVSIREQVAVSFEFFPPKDDAAGNRMIDAVEELSRLGPEFLSVTYGAGGSDRERSVRTVTDIARHVAPPVAAHVTCIGAAGSDIDDLLDAFVSNGVKRFVALRGDLPAGFDRSRLARSDYHRADQLVAAIRRRGDYEISVATYPEKHPESVDIHQDITALKAKQDAGADRAITQFFFDTDQFLRFRDLAVASGVRIPIVPGILPVHNFAATKRFAAGCGAIIPSWMNDLFHGLDDAAEVRDMVATTVATEQCARLIENGVQHLHFYTLNRAELTTAICTILGVSRTQTMVASAVGA